MVQTSSTISPSAVQAERLAGKPMLCVDVRTPMEHRGVHAEGVMLRSLDVLDPEDIRRLRGDDRPIFLFCKSGGRATKAAEQLTKAGISGCCVVEGGTDAWIAAGLPVVRGKAGMSLERQVRIAAGSLVLLGVISGYFFHPAGYALSAFVGAGLIFAGITDYCGMGLLLARMPWNRVSASNGSPCSVK